MRFLLASTFAAFLLVAGQAHAACGPKSDILVRSDASLAPVRPADCAGVRQTPPEFMWPPQQGEHTYTLTLTMPDGRVETRDTKANWLLWNRALPPGKYSWRVKVDGNARLVSEPRTFTVAPDATPFVVPEGASLVERARGAPRPRTWGTGGRKSIAAVRGASGAGWPQLVTEVQNKAAAPVQPEPTSTSISQNYGDTVAEQKRTLAAALAWAVTRDDRYGADATRRLLAQAMWSPLGPTSFKVNDMANRNVAWTLALGFDWVHDRLDARERALIAGAIRARTQPMFEDVVPRLGRYPYDSHGNITLSIVAAIGVLMAGEFPEADTWVREALPLALATTSPWGAQDGGYGNGTSYMFWDTGSLLPAWYIFRNAVGVDIARKEWVRNQARFMAYFVPPGAPAGLFGDGHEMQIGETYARIAKALARFTEEPLAKWYARSLQGEDPSRIELLLAPVVDLGKAALPERAPNAAAFPSVGWVAMHSDLDDPKRTSVYFKSSPYGSYNHSHGDQNGFVIDHRGERLAISSGYYDGYQTPHWREWYKQTRAANAITFDGGKGQGFNGKEFAGEIARFETTPAFDYAVGRAEKAYAGALTAAQRTIVYLRPDKVLVLDRLESASPRTWEWNLHAARRMIPADENAVEVRGERARMCVEMLAAPPLRFEQTDQFTVPPSGKNMPNQWHGVFAARQPSTAAELVVLMHIGSDCASARPEKSSASARRTREGWRIEVDGKTLLARGDAVTLEGPGAPPRNSPVVPAPDRNVRGQAPSGIQAAR